ncbi:ATP-dependent DNA/RNA helicase PSH1, putative [Plasmodium knowlesi strain H]|uniref:ATP-dependent RNA helicase n=2 Tax=Plasmodium knowlesi TaxID=5850 RepID=B3KZN9_PLAKH|nr:ATP-dependent DNA/RNA helicase PSH1, putative [Plasmodium knowlesi strain H]OTN66497.1 Uncharacterized protein PKNOH_S09519700 [Plasmodium knowlesi]CAA9986365.1 ATP-dependent DNA/RNA helicase PSH1, putative [Plasmodium knowlesi strain H]VVS75839.1 ATP-dependent DNA/RNA helicase PSH1, putative [Plasmodium knowlesi strain H]|eukprot:XP_002257771.1 hypothetical protein, conserved in Plasmodium species [Plasmodium knowlesi strain H]
MIPHLLLIAFILTSSVITTPRGRTRARGTCAPTFIRTHPFQIAKSKIQQLYRKKATYVIRERGGHHEEESRKGVRRDKRRNGISSDHRQDTKPKGESTPIKKHSVKKYDRHNHTYRAPSILKGRRKKIYTKEEVKAEKEKQLKGKLRRKNVYERNLKKGKKRNKRINNGDSDEEVDRGTDLDNDTRGDSPNVRKANEATLSGERNRRGRRTKRKRRNLSHKEQKILDMFQNDLNESIERLNKKTRKYELCRQNENLKSGMQGNEILRKVLAVSRSAEGTSRTRKTKERRGSRGNYSSADVVQMNGGVRKYVDDISDDAGEGKTKNLDKRREKEKKEKQKVGLHSSLYGEGKIHKEDTHRKVEKKSLDRRNKIKLSQGKAKNYSQEEDTDKEKRKDESIDSGEVDGDNIKKMKALIKIGKSIDPFRRRIHIDYENCTLSDEVRNRLAKFSGIIDLNANRGGKECDTKKAEEVTIKESKEEYHTFADLGIYDNFLKVYLKYNGIEKPTEYQAKFIPLLIYFMNNGYSDWKNCSGDITTVGGISNLRDASPEGTPSIQSTKETDQTTGRTKEQNDQTTGLAKEQNDKTTGRAKEQNGKTTGLAKEQNDQTTGLAKEQNDKTTGLAKEQNDRTSDSITPRGDTRKSAYPPVERIIYVNKYNERSGKLIRTFFLHCPTGTGKTLMYVLPLFQHITNVCFGVTSPWVEATKEGEPLLLADNSEVTSNGMSDSCATTTSYASIPEDGKTFYVRKEINANVTSFLCSNVKQEQKHFITQNRSNVEAMMNTLTRMNTPGEVKQPHCNEHTVRKKETLSDKHPKKDILIITYNKELAVQIYHLCKDLIDSFFKSFKSKFFELNDSLVWSHLPNVDPQRKAILERLNVNLKKKKNINVHLLIGGNNIKYQLKGLKRPKVHLIGEIPPEGDLSEGDLSEGDLSEGDLSKGDLSEGPSPEIGEENIDHVNIYVGTPGRLERLINERKIINLENISTIILDEYDFFFNSYGGKSSEETKTDKPQVENKFFSKILRSVYSSRKRDQIGRGSLHLPWTSLTNVICCSATPAVYSYLTFTRHIITTNFLRHLHGGTDLVGKKEPMGEVLPLEGGETVEKERPVEGYSSGKSFVQKNSPPIDRKMEQNMLNGLFNLKEFGKIPENLIHLNYTYDRRNREWSNSATMNFLNVLFSNPLRKNVLVFCNTKKRVMDLWSLFRNRFDVDIQTIFAEKNKKRKKVFKDINYANFFKNDLVDYKNLKKYVNFMFLSTNLLYRGINCMGFTTIVNFDMPSGPTEYVHRCGRIGRINNKGIIINIFERSFRRTYKRKIFSKLGIHPYDVDCYMNNFFTLGMEEVRGDVGKEVCKEN